MMRAAAQVQIKTEILKLVRQVPSGRVTTFDAIAVRLKVPPRLVATVLTGLNENEREIVCWHRVVAQGGAIGRGPHRDQQFARLVREGVLVAPAGVVQDLTRVCLTAFDDVKGGNRLGPAAAQPTASGPASRSRGMKDRPA